jgi:phosphoglycolate phosphatase
MSDFPFQIVGFDLDGTLLDTSADLTAAVNHALGMVGRPPLTPNQVKPMIGGGAKLMLEHGLYASGGIPADGFKPLYRALLAFYEANITVHTRPFSGALAVLDQFDEWGIKYAVVTNKFESLARKALGELGLLDRLATVIGGDTLGPGRAKPEADPIREMITRCGGGRAAFIGDSIYDIMAAKAAGIPSVACSFGFLMQPVEELGADAVIDHFDELIPALLRL